MTLPYPDDFDDDDRMLHESLAPLRDLKPTGDWESNVPHLPARLTATNPRESSGSNADGSIRWLLAIAASLLVGMVAGWTLRGSQPSIAVESGPITHPEVDDLVASTAAAPPTRSSANVETDLVQKDRPTYYTEELYLCGVGLVQSSSTYQFTEETP